MPKLRHAALLFACALPGAPAAAEGFIDVYAGRAFPERTPLSLTADQARIDGQLVPASLRVDIRSVKPTNSTIFGIRAGGWFGRHLGIALDVSTLDPDVKRQTVTGTANLAFDESVFGEEVVIAPGQSASIAIPRIDVPTTATIVGLAMVRLPVGATADRPGGRFAPYAYAGPVWLVTDTSFDGSLGLRAGGGVKLPLGRRLALFGEYRYTRVDADATAGRVAGSVRGVSGSTGDIRVDLNLRNHSAVGGLSLTF